MGEMMIIFCAQQAAVQMPEQPPHLDRRSSLIALASAAALCSKPAQASSSTEENRHASDEAQTATGGTLERLTAPDYTAAGPLFIVSLPQPGAHLQPLLPGMPGESLHAALGRHLPARRPLQRHVYPLQICGLLALMLDLRSICSWL